MPLPLQNAPHLLELLAGELAARVPLPHDAKSLGGTFAGSYSRDETPPGKQNSEEYTREDGYRGDQRRKHAKDKHFPETRPVSTHATPLSQGETYPSAQLYALLKPGTSREWLVPAVS